MNSRNWELTLLWDVNLPENFDAGTLIFLGVVHKYVEEGIKLLQITQEGKEWISLLHAHVFECEHFILSDTDS